MSADDETLAVYRLRAQDYAARFARDTLSPELSAFLALLPPGARILDLGCGPGHDSALMAAAGHNPDPVDASPEMVALAQARGLPARQGTFDDVQAQTSYDGVWASFSLLHAPRAALPRHLSAIRRALKPGGVLHLGLKLGQGEGRDPLGRFYAYHSRDELMQHLNAAGFDILSDQTFEDVGLAGVPAPAIMILARVHDA